VAAQPPAAGLWAGRLAACRYRLVAYQDNPRQAVRSLRAAGGRESSRQVTKSNENWHKNEEGEKPT